MKKFLITIDTEGDNMWRSMYSENTFRNRLTVNNGEYILRFQMLCERYGFVPTYLVNYEMAGSKAFVSMAKEKLSLGQCEIGMHMHAWSVPPFYPLKHDKINMGACNPYICEYPEDIIEQKVITLTKHLEDVFDCPIHSHRSGRWLLDEKYLSILKRNGYVVDCSVTPGINWAGNSGLTKGTKGADYRKFPSDTYELNEHDVSKAGHSGILEVPVTIHCCQNSKGKLVTEWLRPTGYNLQSMLQLVMERKKMSCDYLEFMIHSSELMPYGSPNFRTENSIEKLYCDLETVFSKIAMDYEGCTLTSYAASKMKG